MKKSSKFSPEVRERAVRLVQERRGEYWLHAPPSYMKYLRRLQQLLQFYQELKHEKACGCRSHSSG